MNPLTFLFPMCRCKESPLHYYSSSGESKDLRPSMMFGFWFGFFRTSVKISTSWFRARRIMHPIRTFKGAEIMWGYVGGIPFLFHVHRKSVINLKNTSKNGTGFCSGFLPWGRQDKYSRLVTRSSFWPLSRFMANDYGYSKHLDMKNASAPIAWQQS